MSKSIPIERLENSNHQNSSDQAKLSGLWSYLSRLYTYFVQKSLQPSQPQIWQERSFTGETYYRIYDPYSRRSAYFSSENELRFWLEKLPYQ